jgi:SAM-dependent methyltransferase
VTPIPLAPRNAPATEAADPEPLADAVALLGACAWPSEAYWRLLELAAVRRHVVNAAGPVLELGCGDGVFTELTGLQVDLAVDREPRAVERAGRRRSVYRAVRRTDIRDLDAALGPFGTIFANSVLEHVPDLEPVLDRCCELLAPGGRLIATVPLHGMNEHLAVRMPAYACTRQRQLQHRNLWTIDEWRAQLDAAGLAMVTAEPYLDAAACRRWDGLDAVGALGRGRYRVAPILHRFASVALPGPMKRWVKARLALALLDWTRRPAAGPFCAAVLVATKPE